MRAWRLEDAAGKFSASWRDVPSEAWGSQEEQESEPGVSCDRPGRGGRSRRRSCSESDPITSLWVYPRPQAVPERPYVTSRVHLSGTTVLLRLCVCVVSLPLFTASRVFPICHLPFPFPSLTHSYTPVLGNVMRASIVFGDCYSQVSFMAFLRGSPEMHRGPLGAPCSGPVWMHLSRPRSKPPGCSHGSGHIPMAMRRGSAEASL